jgi:thiol-disulfide isomerase/thioredoxin
MIKKVLLVVVLLCATVGLAVLAAFLGNRAPVVRPITAEEAAQARMPYVVKLHAQWCVLCVVTKDVWSDIEDAYKGRVHLVVFDFTNDTNTAASRAEATRLGLDRFLNNYVGATGTVVVLDGRTRETLATINASRTFEEYRVAIDAALARR